MAGDLLFPSGGAYSNLTGRSGVKLFGVDDTTTPNVPVPGYVLFDPVEVAPAQPAQSVATPISGVIIDGTKIPGTSALPYTMAAADRVVAARKAAGSATYVTLPMSPTLWVEYVIVDAKGDAATNHITITAPADATINGAATFVVSGNRFAATLRAIDAKTWVVS